MSIDRSIMNDNIIKIIDDKIDTTQKEVDRLAGLINKIDTTIADLRKDQTKVIAQFNGVSGGLAHLKDLKEKLIKLETPQGPGNNTVKAVKVKNKGDENSTRTSNKNN